MTTTGHRWLVAAVVAGSVLAGGGCDQRKPGESAGQKLDRTTEQIAAKTKEATAETAAALDDAALTAKVKAALFAEPGLKTLQIDVETHDGIVTLAGSVDSASLRERAVKVAGSMSGVRQVVDRLVVKA